MSKRGRLHVGRVKRVVYVSDDLAMLRSILIWEDDFNTALEKIIGFLHERMLVDGASESPLDISDILRLKRGYVLLRGMAAVVDGEALGKPVRTLLDFGVP